MEGGYLCLVLHAHLPYVRHPEHDDFLEEDWLYEAISETYLPLLDLADRLLEEGVPYRLTLSVTPTLAAMLEDPLLQSRYLRHIEKLIELSAREVERTRWIPTFHRLARRYREIFTRCRSWYVERYRCDLLAAFRRLAGAGTLELITSGATHGFLPLMLGQRNLWRAQIQVAAREHRRHFGTSPKGIWLPECGFDPGVDVVLREEGIRYFFTDAHGILNATPRPRYGVFAPVLTPGGVAAFGRDLESSRQVWCAWLGYPGDFDYREFYRDVGWDLEQEYLQPFLHRDGKRTNLGIKYYRITGPTAEKAPYDFERARAKALLHARHFVESRRRQIEVCRRTMDRPPLIVAPYDAELFGHWWFEGPQWLEFVLREAASPGVELIHPSEYLDRAGRLQVATPSCSSWGLKGYAEHWLDRSNDWIYRHLHVAGERMVELANRFSRSSTVTLDPWCDRALRQAAREFLLAQSSDWAFILKAGTMSAYAERRSREHLANFTRLFSGLLANEIDRDDLQTLETRHRLFPDLDWKVFADRPEG